MQTPNHEAFGLDRTRFREHLEREYGEPAGLDALHEHGGLAGSLSGRVYDAHDCGALTGPENTEVQTYASDDALVISVRDNNQSADVPLRQIATYSIETKYLASHQDCSFPECCAAIEEVLRHATKLLPSVRTLQAGEREADPADHDLPQVTVYHGTDGALVVEIDTEQVKPVRHDEAGVPYLRIYVNEGPIFGYSPSAPLPDSREALAYSDADPEAPIGRLIVNTPTSQAGSEH
jgi:hypothetical protein